MEKAWQSEMETKRDLKMRKIAREVISLFFAMCIEVIFPSSTIARESKIEMGVDCIGGKRV